MPSLRIRQSGRMGNNMLQYILARSLAARTSGLEVFGYNMPMWDLAAPVPRTFPKRTARLRTHLIDLDYAARLINANKVSFITMTGIGMRFEHYLPREHFVDVFDGSDVEIDGFGDDQLAVHIRCGDIFGSTRKEYGVLPPSYYRDLSRTYNKQLVFVGETADNFYIEMLRREFPDALFPESLDIKTDFERIRRSKHIALSTSTFAWLAAWLSKSAETIHLPVIGFFDPELRPDINALPLGDPRYIFHSFADKSWFGGSTTADSLRNSIAAKPVETQHLQTLLDQAKWRIRKEWRFARLKFRFEAMFPGLVRHRPDSRAPVAEKAPPE